MGWISERGVEDGYSEQEQWLFVMPYCEDTMKILESLVLITYH